MANPRKPFRINVGFIINEEVGYTHKFPFQFDSVRVSEDLELHNLDGLATITRTPQGLLVQGDFSGEITLDCVRCLTHFTQPLRWQFTELYAFNQKSVTDSGLLLPDDAQIDLQPLVREYALLEVPINPICRADCRGLCPVCGENLNERDCGHRPEQDQSPFSSLKDLLK
ncbi:MAG: YceD family protein [Bacteroidota bacterium]